MNGEPSSVGAPTTATSASRTAGSVQTADRRNDGIPTNGRSSRPPSPSGIGPPALAGMLRTSRGALTRCGWGSGMGASSVAVPAREARAVRVTGGQRFKVVDVEGGQVVDLFAFVADDTDEYASAEHTRVAIERLFPRVGQAFVTNRRRPILRLEEDRSPGVHDMLCAACDPERYRLLGVEGWHASCRENLERAMAGMGHERVAIPQPINLFMDARVQPDGSLALGPAPTEPGD